jgi:hypothetical protein
MADATDEPAAQAPPPPTAEGLLPPLRPVGLFALLGVVVGLFPVPWLPPVAALLLGLPRSCPIARFIGSLRVVLDYYLISWPSPFFNILCANRMKD